MDAKTLAEAFGESSDDESELDESSEEQDDAALGDDLDIVFASDSSPEMRREAFIRAVKAAK